jgi:NADH:ubiquinone oxidoreductase subunit F (NADH-binding)
MNNVHHVAKEQAVAWWTASTTWSCQRSDLLNSVADNIQGQRFAPSDAAAMPVRAMISVHRHEFEAMIPKN